MTNWAFHNKSLETVLPGYVSMKANTALCFVLSGISLLACLHAYGAAVNLWTVLAISIGVGLIAARLKSTACMIELRADSSR